MKLSELQVEGNIEIIKDGEFGLLGYSDTYISGGVLTFVTDVKFVEATLKNKRISAVICSEILVEHFKSSGLGIIVSKSPKLTLFKIHEYLVYNNKYNNCKWKTKIGKGCKIADSAVIANVNVDIGENVIIEENVVIRENVTIGKNAIIRVGTTIGGKGFSFTKDLEGNNIQVTDTAKIEIGENVELFEYVNVSKGIFPWEVTKIGSGTKIDAKCHIAHGTYIGKNCLIAEGAKCCGNTTIGDNVWIGVNATISNRVIVEDHARVSIGAVVTQNVKERMTVTGNFAIPHEKFIANIKKTR